MKPRDLDESEKALLGSVEGLAAFISLLPLIRETAMYIAGAGPCPPRLQEIPELKSRVELERLHYRSMRKRDGDG